MKQLYIIGLSVLVGLILGFTISYNLYKPTNKGQETYQKEQKQSDGSVILEKKPIPDAKPEQAIPKTMYVDRIIKVIIHDTVIPEPIVIRVKDPVKGIDTLITCPPCIQDDVTVDLTLVTDKKTKAQRVIASTPHGIVVGGVDIPVQNVIVPKELNNSLGLVANYNLNKDINAGLFYQRAVGPFVVGGEILSEVGNYSNVGVGVNVGFRF